MHADLVKYKRQREREESRKIEEQKKERVREEKYIITFERHVYMYILCPVLCPLATVVSCTEIARTESVDITRHRLLVTAVAVYYPPSC